MIKFLNLIFFVIIFSHHNYLISQEKKVESATEKKNIEKEIKAIHMAIRKNDIAFIEKALKKSPKLMNRQSAMFKATPLVIAVIKDKVKIAKFLLEKGADINIPENHGYTPLYLAINNKGFRSKDKKMLKLLMSYHPKPNLKDWRGRTVLFNCVMNLEKLEWLMVNIKDVDVNSVDNDNMKALDVLIENTLVSRHLNIKKYEKNIQLLLKNKAIHSPFSSIMLLEKDALTKAFANEPALINKKINSRQSTLLMYAVMKKDINLVEQLLKLGANPNTPSQLNRFHSNLKKTVKKTAVKTGVTAIFYAVINGSFDTVELLIKHKATLDFQTDTVNSSLLHLAVLDKNVKIIDLLIKSGIDVTLKNKRKQTALDLAKLVYKKNKTQLDKIKNLIQSAK